MYKINNKDFKISKYNKKKFKIQILAFLEQYLLYLI